MHSRFSTLHGFPVSSHQHGQQWHNQCSAGNNFSLCTEHSDVLFTVTFLWSGIFYKINLSGQNLLSDNSWKIRQLKMCLGDGSKVIMSDHNVKLAGHFQNLAHKRLSAIPTASLWMKIGQLCVGPKLLIS